ncbi:MAG: peptide chain release factor N(5)-glutamine methyltransferase [Schwartzia sp.]|nr:peptide chain release factor N(5)-glutamine methyltransferase [Schwartzia sp. (in: firmicutes)]
MADEQVWTIGRILKWSEQYFRSRGIDTPRLDAEVLLSHVLGEKRIFLYVNFDKPLQKEELALYREMVKRRAAREPVAYIVGARDFMGLRFKVSPAVLVPQPDTETLVGAVMDRLENSGDLRIADIGTGSGAIALSLLYYMPSVTAAAVDISGEALEVARENAVKLGLEDRVTFYEGDLFSPLEGEKFAAVVSNPPYIPHDDIEGLEPEVKAEPLGALDGGADGLDFYRRLVDEAGNLLAEKGFLAMEVGINEAAEVADMAKTAGWERSEIIADLAGIDRVVVLWKK